MRLRGKKVLLLGSGGLTIGQAGEFDYSGAQAIKALKEMGAEVILINPNIAAVQTDPGFADQVYFWPVTPEFVERILIEKKPDAIVGGFGGQTALNCLIQLEEQGILARHGVENWGTPVATLQLTEDRELFASKMREIGVPVPPSGSAQTVDGALTIAGRIGYPVIARAAYALGGLGSGFAHGPEQLTAIVTQALAFSPQVLIEKSLRGWKELEYEVMRDAFGNAITICNMENFDPLGIHTGDSIVVAPSQTLSDEEYQQLRDASLRIVNSLGVIGECNVQWAHSPDGLEMYVIEVNARLSRSSALASKATGYPIAFIAAQVVSGLSLLEIRNPMTGTTCALFEPAMDYLVMKIPRWDLTKFVGAHRGLGSAMKSVGEVMAIGRSLPEALQKGMRMVTENAWGLLGSNAFAEYDEQRLEAALEEPTDQRIFAVIEALRRGWEVSRIHSLTRIDSWFLARIQEISEMEALLRKKGLNLDADTLRRAKCLGFSDAQIAASLSSDRWDEHKVRAMRLKSGIRPVAKRIDTTAAEYASPSNYFYLTYGADHPEEMGDEKPAKHNATVLVLGGGTYRIGTSVEFDWCAVSAARELRDLGIRSVIINCNPETVSTDFNTSDRLYFEELSLERILDIRDEEMGPDVSEISVMTAMGGQQPNRLALPLERAGLQLLGHSGRTIEMAENRSLFAQALDEMGVAQPLWTEARSESEISQFVEKCGFPLLVRPSFVLSGAAMNVAFDAEALAHYLRAARAASPDHPVVLSRFHRGMREVEVDAVCSQGKIIACVVSEHIENAGVHSGDATVRIPPSGIGTGARARVLEVSRQIAQKIGLNGPANFQFLVSEQGKSAQVLVIECNARAARSFPFSSKTVGQNLARLATRVVAAPESMSLQGGELRAPDGRFAVKAAMFSFARLPGADPVLGVEMASTGEVGCFGRDEAEALRLAFEASGLKRPRKGILISAGREEQKMAFLPVLGVLRSWKEQGMKIYATPGTAQFLLTQGLSDVETAAWEEGQGAQTWREVLRKKQVDLVINIPKNFRRKELSLGREIRRTAIAQGQTLITNEEKAVAFLGAWGADFLTKMKE